MADDKPIFVNNPPAAAAVPAINGVPLNEEARARDLARRYRADFIDLRNFYIQHELFKSVPVDLMFRHNFVPLEENDGTLSIAIADPSRLMMIDEIGLLLKKHIVAKVATLSQISDILKKTEQSQRVLEDASESFTLNVVREDEAGEETISIEKLT